MHSIKSLRGYGKVNEAEDREFCRKTRRCLLLIGVSVALLLVIVVGAAVAIILRRVGGGDDHPSPDGGAWSPSSSLADSIKTMCSVTRYPASCFSSLSSSAAARANTTSTDSVELFKLSLRVAADELSKLSALPEDLSRRLNDKKVVDALRICKEMFDDAVDHLNTSLDSLHRPSAEGEKLLTTSKIEDLKTWPSAALTDQETCLDAFEGVAGGFREQMASVMRNSTRFTSALRREREIEHAAEKRDLGNDALEERERPSGEMRSATH